MKNQTIKIYLVLLTTLLLGCSENENIVLPETKDELPPITQTGANTFGCLIDGNVFIPKDKTGYTPPGGGTPKGIEILGNNSVFVIQARNYTNIYIYIYIPENLPIKTTYKFGSSPGVSYGLNSPNLPHLFCIINNKKFLSSKNSGEITFTKANFNSKIYSGVFNLTLKNQDNPNETLEIKDGRFDINLITIDN